MVENLVEYTKRKIAQMEELLRTALDNPDIVSNFFIMDTVVRLPDGQFLPVIRIQVEINDSRLEELKKKK